MSRLRSGRQDEEEEGGLLVLLFLVVVPEKSCDEVGRTNVAGDSLGDRSSLR